MRFYFKVFKTVVEMLHEWDFFREGGIYITEGTRPSSSVLMLKKKLVEKKWGWEDDVESIKK